MTVEPKEAEAVESRALALVRPLTLAAFRRLWGAQLISEIGDWSARLVLSVLVFQRTGSAALTGLATTASLVGWLGPGQLLTSVSERWPRRRVLVAADLVRAVAFAVAMLPLPVPVLLGVVFCAGLVTPPFEAARSALRPEIVPIQLYPAAVSLSAITQDVTIAIGYVVGGALVALLGASTALLVNAGSFAMSAILLTGLPGGKAPRPGPASGVLRTGLIALRADPLISRAVVLVTAALFAATSITALAAPLALHVLGAGPAAVGALVALAAVVSIIATAVVPTGADPARLLRWATGYSLIGGAVTGICFLAVWVGAGGRTPVAVLAFAGSGLLFAVLAPANVVVSPRLPAEVRASALSLLMGALVATEALGAAMSGVAAAAAGIAPVCVALGAPPLVVGAYCLAVSVDRRAAAR